MNVRISLLTVALLISVASPGPTSAAQPIRLLPSEHVPLAQRCARDHRSQTILVAVATDGYGLCDYGDRYTGGEALYRIEGTTIIPIGHGGGQMAASDMEILYHVPAPIANALIALRGQVRREKGEH